MTNLENTWGGLPYDYPLEGEDSVHPDDRSKLRELAVGGLLFQYLRTENEYIVLRYRDNEYRVNPKIYFIIKIVPKFGFGEKVFPKNHPERIGILYDITWHIKQHKEMYYIKVGNKRISKRYWKEDLEAVNGQ